MIRLRQLEAFRAVMHAASVTQAAEMLRISQPAVSRLIAGLEQDFGFPLFSRRRGRLQPTPEATFLLGDVEQAISNLDHIGQIAEDIRHRRTGHLRIACLPGFATSLLPRMVAKFLSDHPNVTVSLQPSHNQRVQEWIMAQQYDVGFTEIPVEHPAIESESLHVRCVCILPKNHALADREVLTPNDLDELPIISMNRDHPQFHALRQAFDQAGARFNVRVETRQFASACIMVSEGAGVAIVSPIDADEFLDRGLEVRRFEPSVSFGLGILYPAHRPRSLILAEFVATFRDNMKPYLMGPTVLVRRAG